MRFLLRVLSTITVSIVGVLIGATYVEAAETIPGAIAGAQIYDVSKATITGERLIGSHVVQFIGINPFRYKVTRTVDSTIVAGPDPSSLLQTPKTIGPAPAPSSTPKPGFSAPAPCATGDTATELNCLNGYMNKPQAALHTLLLASDNATSKSDSAEVMAALRGLFDSGQEVDKAKAAVDYAAGLVVDSPAYLDLKSKSGLPASDQTAVTQMEAAVTQLTTSQQFLKTVSKDDLQQSDALTCNGLLNEQKTSIVKLTLTPSDSSDQSAAKTSDVTIICLAPVVFSTGYLFSNAVQNTFAAQTDNNPNPTASPTAHVVQTSHAAVRPVAMALINVRLGVGEQCPFFSFGAAVNSGNSSSTIDFAAGFSKSIFRTLFLTVGDHLGTEVAPAPGYEVGKQITPGASVPTLSHIGNHIFLGITFSFSTSGGGTTTSGTTSSTPAPSPTPTPTPKS